MKRCPKCGQLKHETDFYKDTTRVNGLAAYCKVCKDKLTYNRRRKIYNPKPKPAPKVDPLGGYNISILKYAKQGEFKYTIVSTKGGVFNTNDKDKFLSKLQEVI